MPSEFSLGIYHTAKMNNLCNMRNNNFMIIRYMIYGLLGMNMEIFWTGLSGIRFHSKNLIGHTSVWMFFVYGLAVVVLEPVHNLISDQNWFFRGCVYTMLIFAIEFTTGYLLRIFGIEAWNYTTPLSILGLIRLDYAPAWFIAGMIFEQLHNLLIRYNIGAFK